MTRVWRHRAGWVALALWVSCGAAQAIAVKDYDPTGPQPSVVDEKGERRALYKQSHALLISVSDYLGPGRKGWKPLKETGREMDRVAEALRPHGFRVRRVSDPNGVELHTAIRDFLAEYGRDENHRLLVFFSGHGHTDRDTDMGYLVSTDALDPNLNPQGFFAKALPIESLQTSAKSIRARHAVFLFDSCFSGSIFMSKALPTQPEPRGVSVSERFRFLTGKAAQPVRQFIAAGGPDEPLPAQSQFVPLFIQALSGSGSRVGDGYVTGKELGQWLEQTLPSYNRHQNPHSDVIKVPQLSFGDVVFQVPGSVAQTRTIERDLGTILHRSEWLGLTVVDLTAEQVKGLNLKRGVLVASVDGPAARAGVREGDVILSLGNSDVENTRQFELLLSNRDTARPAALLVRRGDWAQYVVVRSER